LFLSYRHSPLVVSDDKAWWKIGTHKTFELLVSNPLKILLSVSLLALLVFIDIGFCDRLSEFFAFTTKFFYVLIIRLGDYHQAVNGTPCCLAAQLSGIHYFSS
jgi:hypothetical protein